MQNLNCHHNKTDEIDSSLSKEWIEYEGFKGEPLKVLYLTSKLPIPPLVKGDTLRDFYIIKELAARGHEVVLISFYRKNENVDPNLEIIRKYCCEIKLIKFEMKMQFAK